MLPLVPVMTLVLIGFGFLVLAFLIALYKLWLVERRRRIREKEMATSMMEHMWRKNSVPDETSASEVEGAESE